MPSKNFYIIGSGFSRLAGLPTARELRNSIATNSTTGDTAQIAAAELWRKHSFMSDLSSNCVTIAREIAEGMGALSLNWDLALELALNELDSAWTYGRSGAFSIFKPHGSINWTDQKSKDMTLVLRGYEVFYSAAAPFEQPSQGNCVLDAQLESDTSFFRRMWDLAFGFSREADQTIYVGVDRKDCSASSFERITHFGKGLPQASEVA